MVKWLSQNTVNLNDYPVISADVCDQITIGDLHANALKLLYILIQESVIHISRADYEFFKTIYHTPVEEIDEELLIDIIDFCENMEVVNNQKMICFIGDERADRGQNDLYIDLILNRLNDAGCPYEILLSNHGAISLQQLERYKLGQAYFPPEMELDLPRLQEEEAQIRSQIQALELALSQMHSQILHQPIPLALYQLHCSRVENYLNAVNPPMDSSEEDIAEFKAKSKAFDNQYTDFYLQHQHLVELKPVDELCEKFTPLYRALQSNQQKQKRCEMISAQRLSFKNFNHLIRGGLLEMRHIESIHDTIYAPKLKLLSYRIDVDNQIISIFSHAPCGINTIIEIGRFFSIFVDTSSAFRFAKSIDAINKHFQEEYVQKYRIHTLLQSSSSILSRFIWNRDYTSIERTERINCGQINYIHGHDCNESNRPPHVMSLDSSLGGLAFVNGTSHPVHSGLDLVLRSTQEYTVDAYLQHTQKRLQTELEVCGLSRTLEVFLIYQTDIVNISSVLDVYASEIKSRLAFIPEKKLESHILIFETLLRVERITEKYLGKVSIFAHTSSVNRIAELKKLGGLVRWECTSLKR